MPRTAFLFGLALLGHAGVAAASDLDDVAPSGQAAFEGAALAGPAPQQRRQTQSHTKSNGNRSVTHSKATNGHGQTVHRVTATHGDKTVTATRGTSTRNTASGATRTQTRTELSRSNGERGGTREGGGHTTYDRNGHRPPAMPAHARPSTVVRGGHPRVVHTVRYAHVRPYHGVFVYGPRPSTHVHYVNAGGPVEVVRQDLPERAVNREDTFALGVKAGSLLSASDGYVYGDPGLGGIARYRPDESLGLELDVSHHWGNGPVSLTRGQTQVAGSVALFAFPWTRVSPYVLGGVTWNGRTVTDEVWTNDNYEVVRSGLAQWGLHGGVGLELALGKSVALDLEGRGIGWLARERGDAPMAVQATAGLLVHFD